MGSYRTMADAQFSSRNTDSSESACCAAQASGESCPIFPGRPRKLHWSMPDPAKAYGSEVDIEAAFDRVLFMLKEHIEKLVHSLRLQSLLKGVETHEGIWKYTE